MDNLDLTKNQISFDEYITLVIAESRKLGYIHSQAYYYEIQESFHKLKTVGECVYEVFGE